MGGSAQLRRLPLLWPLSVAEKWKDSTASRSPADRDKPGFGSEDPILRGHRDTQDLSDVNDVRESYNDMRSRTMKCRILPGLFVVTVFAVVCRLVAGDVVHNEPGYGVGNIPDQGSYAITIQGVTSSGSTAFPQRNTVYSPLRRFQIAGKLVVVPVQDHTGVTWINARDIAIVCGNPTGSPQAGAIWFASNTRVFGLAGLGNSIQKNANLNSARVSLNEASGTMSITVAPQSVAKASQVNCFNTQGGLFAQLYQITSGKIALQFFGNGSRVTGQMNFIGTGYVGPGNSGISGSITGVRR
jgi:hypothetical protein